MLEIVNNIQRQNKFYSDEYTNEEMDDVLLDFGYSASSDSKEEKGKKLFNGLNKLPTILDESETELNSELNFQNPNHTPSNSSTIPPILENTENSSGNPQTSETTEDYNSTNSTYASESSDSSDSSDSSESSGPNGETPMP